jgi:hypothetical protein
LKTGWGHKTLVLTQIMQRRLSNKGALSALIFRVVAQSKVQANTDVSRLFVISLNDDSPSFGDGLKPT